MTEAQVVPPTLDEWDAQSLWILTYMLTSVAVLLYTIRKFCQYRRRESVRRQLEKKHR